MRPPIEFYFDFASPYAYLASHRIDTIAAKHGRPVAWRPFMLGIVFKTTGAQPLVTYPLKGPYAARDLARSARLSGVPFVFPPGFPHATLAAARGFYWLEGKDEVLARRFAKAVFNAYFGEGRDVSGAEAVAAIAAALGVDRTAFEAGIQSPAIKERLKSETEGALAKGIFGSPFFLVDGEPFWGADRLDQVERWLANGGW
ncbi:MAG: 2-hydroxychromene-2-carboxylate isomerase [Alphaproteobacteria bacterium]|nr:2-hydroxychromene-2-carboxylate isomerase [Alphaproteobacteria bacterium]